MKKLLLLAFTTLALGFLYGFVSGTYRIFPFHQIAYLKNTLWEGRVGVGGGYVPPAPDAVTLQDTGLQRLLVKRVPLPVDPLDLSGGGGLSAAGGVAYVFTSPGQLLAFDLDEGRALKPRVDPVPMNREALMRSRVRYDIFIPWFRVSGVLAEQGEGGSHTLFVSHNVFHEEEGCITLNVSRITVVREGEELVPREGWRTIFTTQPCMHPVFDVGPGRHPFSGHISGGTMIPYDQRRLLMTVGDFTYDGHTRPAWAQDDENPYGQYILLDRETGEYETYATGGRNAMGMFRDWEGTIWATESGPQDGDELNVIRRGANYGWPLVTYGIDYESTPWPMSEDQGRHDAFDQPLFAWIPSIVPTNLVRIPPTSESFRLWTGDLVLGSLRGQSLHRLRFGDDGRIVYDEQIPMGDRIRDLVRLDDGTLLLLTDGTGQLVFVGDGGAVFEEMDEEAMARLVRLEAYGGLTAGETDSRVATAESLFRRSCNSCHVVEGPGGQVGPHLNELFGRRVGGVEGYNYSGVLRAGEERWTPELLREYLLDPEAVFPGSRMPRVNLSPEEADSIVAYLRR